MSPTPKKIRSQPADVIVAVGSDANMQEFECYKIALSFASPYFDAMLSVDMVENNSSRIEFPDKSPEEWKLFYSFIDPKKIGAAKHDANISKDNAMTLTPWFHEFQMEAFLVECDQVLSKKVISLSWESPGGVPTDQQEKSYWKKPSKLLASASRKKFIDELQKSEFKQIIELLQFACVYDLEKTKVEAEYTIKFLLDELEETSDLFDRPTTKVLVDLFLPIVEEEDQRTLFFDEDECEEGLKCLVSRGKSTVLWNYLVCYDFEIDSLGGLSLDAINNSGMLAVLVETTIELYASNLEKCRVEALFKDALSSHKKAAARE
ncbi:hypothetical protein ACHAXR_002780 [Thalassiosira sp. AJA248-18]